MIRAYAILAATLLPLGCAGGWQINDWRLGQQITGMERDVARARAEAAEQREAKEKALAQRNSALTDALIAELEAEHAHSQVITREVIRYVQSPDAGHCRLPDEWVQLHESAATGSLPVPASTTRASSGETRAVTDTDALAVITANYQQCRRDKARLQGWQQWYREVASE